MSFIEEKLNRENRQLIAQRESLVGLLERILQWDHFDAAGDGDYWRREIQSSIRNARKVAV